MEHIVLSKVEKQGNQLRYIFQVSEGLNRFFSGKPFIIEYPFSVDDIPDSVVAIPFVSSVLPLIWLIGGTLEVESLDQTFYLCLPKLKHGYERMYPELDFPGTILVKKVEANQIEVKKEKSAVFFSGGLDSVFTLIEHLDENPDLLCIWGSDIAYDNDNGWKSVHDAVKGYANQFHLTDVPIHSAFRTFDLEWEIDAAYQESLGVNWWYGFKHGIALLGHAAPYAYLHNVGKIYIASSNSPAEGKVQCASDPSLDNNVQFCNCQVIHDGFEFDRQGKIHGVVQYVCKTGVKLPLHVCWESQSGSNCCECEKCYRTMMGLIVEGMDPVLFGFNNCWDNIGKMRRVLVGEKKISKHLVYEWSQIQKKMLENRDQLKHSWYWKYIKWLEVANLANPGSIKLPKWYRVRIWMSQFVVFQSIYRIKSLLKNSR